MNQHSPAVAHLLPLKHTFELPKWIPADQSRSGRPQTERTCKVCGAVRVTLHGDDVGRAWRARGRAAG